MSMARVSIISNLQNTIGSSLDAVGSETFVGVDVLQKPMFEKYLNDPALTKPEDLLAELWIPIA